MAGVYGELYDKVTHTYAYQRNKHGLGETYVEDQINAMSNHDLLIAISEALEAMGKEKEKGDG